MPRSGSNPPLSSDITRLVLIILAGLAGTAVSILAVSHASCNHPLYLADTILLGCRQ
ncbi:MAG TPA: hypothetical protein VF748_11680 [Candidatus Acidoferrum sp.]